MFGAKYRRYIADISGWSEISAIIFDFLSIFIEILYKHGPAQKEDDRFVKKKMREEEEKEERKERKNREK